MGITKGFTKEEKSSFPYWFSHWCAFQMVALSLHVWKFKYLFHDIEKPWLRLFLPYHKVRKFHRRYHKHHLGYRNPEKIDWMELVIDWECCRYTKIDCPLNARETLEDYLAGDNHTREMKIRMKENIIPILNRLGI